MRTSWTNSTQQAQVAFYRQLFEQSTDPIKQVSSESLEHKRLRYEMISRGFAEDQQFSLHDVGMGLADYAAYLHDEYPDRQIVYSGSDILPEFCEASSARFPKHQFYQRDIAEQVYPERYDYVVMSGVFYQKRQTSIRDWEAFMLQLVSNAFRMTRKALIFNVVSPFVDYYQPEIYYCNLPKLLNFISDRLSRFFVLHHNYALYEMTIVVQQPDYVASLYPQSEFRRYFPQRSP